MSIADLRDVVARLHASTSALAGLGIALDAAVRGRPPAPALAAAVERVVRALGVDAAIAAAGPDALRPLAGEVRTHALAAAALLGGGAAGWVHTDAALLEAAGDVSTAFPATLATSLAPELGDLAARLARPGAAFLDVGAGVAALSIAMARRWPALRVVAVEPWAPAADRARQHVAGAGLGDRVEVRAIAGEAIADAAAFDLAWVPGVFVPGAALPAVLARVARALRPGGWLVLPFLRPVDDALTAAVAHLRAVMFGGAVTAPAALEALVTGAGLAEVRTLAAAPASAAALVVGRRP